jgi:DNA-binding NtrC family response regulator
MSETMDKIYTIIAGSNTKPVAAIRKFILTLNEVKEYCDVEYLHCSTPQDLLKIVIEKTQHSKVIAIMLEDILPRFENSGYNSRIIQHSYEKTALHPLLKIPELQSAISSILIFDYPGFEADDTTNLVDHSGNFSIVSGSFDTHSDDAGWRHLKSALIKSIRRFTEAQKDATFSGLKGKMLGNSKAMKEVFSLIDRFAPSDSTVLIEGESGTGKELVARQIHDQSKRSKGPFVPVNCGAIPEGLVESELFGHEKGSFTGAIAMRKGKFEIADGGTIFLDEIGELPLQQQVKLLRVLQERKITRVGGDKLIEVDVRVIAATNKDINAMVAAKEFREDLFYRINVCRITIPPLRERPKDILPLANHFLKLHNAKSDPPKTFEAETLNDLQNYSWPGNVRELQNVVEGAFIRSDLNHITSILVRTIMHSSSIHPAHIIDASMSLKEMEKKHIQSVLDRCEGNKAEALKILCIDRKTLDKKIHDYGLIIHR